MLSDEFLNKTKISVQKNEDARKHINNIIYNDGVKFFCKKFYSASQLLREFQGYKEVLKYYPVPKLMNSETCIMDGQMIFEFENTIASNRGLLLDIFNRTENKDAINKIYEMFASVFSQTIKVANANAADIFFKDRIPNLRTRYAKWLTPKSIPQFTFNGFNVKLNLSTVIEGIERYFEKREGAEIWSIVSQADPTDLNIGVKPIIFDYAGGGRVPLMAEFANIVWEQLAISPILGPTYNPGNYTDHDLSFKNILPVNNYERGIAFSPLNERVAFLEEYIRLVIMPVMDKIEYSGWYDDFKNHIAMRILGVFDVTGFSSEHKLFALGYLDLFYNAWDTKSPEDIVKFIRKHGNN